MNDTSIPTGVFTALVLETFRLNGELIAAGDSLTRDLGLTSARWQVLGALELAGRPLGVARVARAMGLSRQAVQRTVNDLAAMGFADFAPNPDHKRAKLVMVTEDGHGAYHEAMRRHDAWAQRVVSGLGRRDLEGARAILASLADRVAGESAA